MNTTRAQTNLARLLAGLVTVCALLAAVQFSTRACASEPSTASQQLNIKVGDRLAAAILHNTPDVYLSGVIDSDAPARFMAMMKSGQIPVGSNIYLNSPGGSLAAGLALGRLFRSGGMTTTIGRPPFVSDSNPKSSGENVICASACAYAYLGGMWRWAPTVGAPFGVHQFYLPEATTANVGEIEAASGTVVAYLHAMGINPDVFTLASTAAPDHVVWLDGSEMLQLGLANNGVKPIDAEYKLLAGIPYLLLDQQSRDGEHKIVMLCVPADVSLQAIYIVGHDRATQIVGRGIRSYFSVDGKQSLPADPGSLHVVNGAVEFDTNVPKSFLGRLTGSRSIGAWVDDQNGRFRTGFFMELGPVRSKIQNYYENCAGSTTSN
ncbi:MAG: hypothetical protein ACRD45_10695 [Bryobacteraceae bacterium]